MTYLNIFAIMIIMENRKALAILGFAFAFFSVAIVFSMLSVGVDYFVTCEFENCPVYSDLKNISSITTIIALLGSVILFMVFDGIMVVHSLKKNKNILWVFLNMLSLIGGIFYLMFNFISIYYYYKYIFPEESKSKRHD